MAVDKLDQRSKIGYGFTIVELLIVIVVIAILAAISIVAYTGIQNRAHDTAIQNDLAAISKKFELFYVDNDRYPNAVAELGTLDAKATKSAYLTDETSIQANLVPCRTTNGQEYSLAAISKSEKRFYVTKGGSVREYTGGTSWHGTSGNYNAMCSSTLSGSSVIGSGSGWYNPGSWRSWVGG
jgi:prepilin-type N-terminal cleavage/methylation domain-containing protein